jgi:parvulin-like peptidyl-prolyl isomerase
MKFSRAVLSGLILALAFSLVSCSSREDVVLAEFKDKTITVGRFEKSYAAVDTRFLPASSGIEGYREFVTTILNKEVMAYKADELGYDKDPGVIQGMEAYRGMGLQAGYLKIRVSDRVKVTEDEIKEHYRNKGSTLSVKQLLVDTPDEAQDVYQMLLDGGDFDTICREFSKGPDAEEGGKVLTVAYGSYGPNLQKAMFSLGVGEFTEPQETPYGYFIIKVLRRTDARQKDPYDMIHETLEQEVRVLNEMVLTNDVTGEVREAAGVVWFWDNIRIAFEVIPPDRSLTNPPDRRDEVYPLLYLEHDDLDKPLLSYNDKIVTIKDFSDFYDRASFFTRPRREFRLGGIKLFLTERMMAELVVEEMARSNIEEHPEIKAAINAKQEELMINRLYEDMVNAQTVVTQAMVADYYNANVSMFRTPEKRRFGVILTGDIERARAAHQEIQDGKRFRSVAMEYSIDEATLETLAETGLLSEGEQPEMDKYGFALERVGAVTTPFESSRGWMILKLTEKTDAGQFTQTEANDSIRRALKQMENDARLNELLAKWKEELGVVINEKNLSKIDVEERNIPGEATETGQNR